MVRQLWWAVLGLGMARRALAVPVRCGVVRYVGSGRVKFGRAVAARLGIGSPILVMVW